MALNDQTTENLSQCVDAALRYAAEKGADQAEVAATEDSGLSISARMRDIETLEYQNDRGLGLTVYLKKAKGSASTADFSAEAIRQAVDKALSIASQTTPDECAGLADESLLAEDPPTLALDFPWQVEPEQVRELALECEAAALDSDARISNSEGGAVSTGRSFRVYGNSLGFRGKDCRTRHSISCSVLAESAQGMERDYDYSVARDAADLPSAASIGRKAASRTISRLDARSISTRETAVVFSADMARGFFGHAAGAMSGSAQYRRSSFLLDASGEQIFPEWLNWHERPHLEKGLASAAFDNEGVRTSDRELVRKGCFDGYILSSYSARRLGLTSTGNAGGLHNVLVESDQGLADDILAEMGEGLLVTELMGQGVNPVTGDYSRGAAGFWIEKGKCAYPVTEITIAGNLREMYANITALGADIDRRGTLQCGSVLVSSMTVAGS